jgi:hypothetical protein
MPRDPAEAARIVGYIDSLDAQVVYEHQHGGDIQHGPAEFSKVGYRIGDRVTWLASAYYPSGNDAHQWNLAEATAKEIVRRWKEGKQP